MHIVGEDLLRALYYVGTILQGIWERFSCKNDRNGDSHKSSYKFTFIPFLSLQINQTQESNFQQVGGLVTRKSFAFCLQWVAFYFKSMPNSIDFYKNILLYVIHVPIIVSWSYQILWYILCYYKCDICLPLLAFQLQGTLLYL